MTTLELALVAAANAFLKHYVGAKDCPGVEQPPPRQSEPPSVAQPTPTSNGIPVCARHGKAMANGKYGYHCATKENDPAFANKSGWCNAKAKQ